MAHQDKLKRMNEDMEEVFQRKVEEKEERMRRLERDENTRVEQERKAVQDEKVFKYFNFYILCGQMHFFLQLAAKNKK